MKSKILAYFENRPGEYISGEKISKDLNISRAGVWKHLNTLRKEGYEFDSLTKRGYKLKSVPNLVSPERVIPLLKTKVFGRNYHYHNKLIDSTNDLAKELARNEEPEGSVVVAEAQSQGRGRLSRGWFSPNQKGMWISIIFRPDFLPQEAPKMTLFIAVAMAKLLNQYGLPGGIKWPNDILIGNKKIVGILTELSAEVERIHYIVTGIGLNINIEKDDFPEELREIATSLELVTNTRWDRSKIVADFLLEVESLYAILDRDGFEPILVEWRKYNVTLGREVEVVFGDESYEGKAVDIDSNGALWVEKKDGSRELVQAGDVSIKKIKI